MRIRRRKKLGNTIEENNSNSDSDSNSGSDSDDSEEENMKRRGRRVCLLPKPLPAFDRNTAAPVHSSPDEKVPQFSSKASRASGRMEQQQPPQSPQPRVELDNRAANENESKAIVGHIRSTATARTPSRENRQQRSLQYGMQRVQLNSLRRPARLSPVQRN